MIKEIQDSILRIPKLPQGGIVNNKISAIPFYNNNTIGELVIPEKEIMEEIEPFYKEV